MAIGILFLLFIGMSVVSILGIAAMFLLRAPEKRSAALYTMAVWAMIIGALGASSEPSGDIAGQAVRWAIGGAAAVAALVYMKAGTQGQKKAAAVSVALAVILGIGKLFYLI